MAHHPHVNFTQRALNTLRRGRNNAVRFARNNPWETAGLVAGELIGFALGDSFPERLLLAQGMAAAGAMLPRRPAEAAGAITGALGGHALGNFFEGATSGSFIPMGFADSGGTIAGGALGAYYGNRARESAPGRFVEGLFTPARDERLRRELVRAGWDNAFARQAAARYRFHLRNGVPEPIGRAAVTEARTALQRAGYNHAIVDAGETLYIQNREGGMDPDIAREKTLLYGNYMHTAVPEPMARECAETYAQLRGSGLQPAAAQGAAAFYRGRRNAGVNPTLAVRQTRQAYGLPV